MAKKLLSSLIAKTGWRSLFKPLVGFVALLFSGLIGFSFWGIVVFLGASSWIYFSEGIERTDRRSYFWLLTLWAIAAGTVSFGPGFYTAAVVYALLLYVWIGDVRLIWSDRPLVGSVGETGLFAACAVLLFYLFSGVRTMSFWGDLGLIVAVFFASFILVRGAFRSVSDRFARRERLVSSGGGLILAEMAAVLVFLPLGFLNAAAVLTLVFVILKDVVAGYFRGFLDTGRIFRDITVLTVFLVLIFAVVPWVLQ